MGQIPAQNIKYYTVDEAARYLGVSRATIYRDVKANRIRTFKRGRIRRISSENLDSYIEDHTTSMPNEEDNGGENE